MDLNPEARLQVTETENMAWLRSELVTSEVCLLCTQPWEEPRDGAPQSEWRAWRTHREGWQRWDVDVAGLPWETSWKC